MNYGYDQTVEVDEAHPEHATYLYAGVRIRRLTHYSSDDLDEIVRQADAIYDDVMDYSEATS